MHPQIRGRGHAQSEMVSVVFWGELAKTPQNLWPTPMLTSVRAVAPAAPAAARALSVYGGADRKEITGWDSIKQSKTLWPPARRMPVACLGIIGLAPPSCPFPVRG